MRIVLLVVAACFTTPAKADTKILGKEHMSLTECKRKTATVFAAMKLPGIVIVDTNQLYMRKAFVTDGELLITCSEPDRTMLITLTTE